MDEARRWARIEEVFHAALEEPADGREAFVERACAGDRRLADRVRDLLRAEEGVGDFLDTPIARVTDLESAGNEAGATTIGPYRMVRPLGAGGMGEVFLCVDETSEPRHFVAVKLLRPDAGGRLAERFDRERTILAQLVHPGIARFMGTGTTEDHRPFYVMEHVEGEPIDRFSRRRLLTVRHRVALVLKVCTAVQYAHANLIVHRDLKPGNILITGDGEPKLLDFGIARIVSDEGEELTRTEDLLATPVYAAPEQLKGAATTTATDVYALGVLLYELLSGHRPCTAEQARLRALSEHPDPIVPPSTASSRMGVRRLPDGDEETITPEAVSGQRQTGPAGLRRALRGDLDNIVMKAMSHAPQDRYVTAAALADDLERYLLGQPVRARRASWTYRARKFVQRNPLATAATVAFVVTLVGAVLMTRAQALEIANQASRVESERDRAVAVQGFLLESFGAAGDEGVVGDPVTVRQVLDRQAAEIEASLPGEALGVDSRDGVRAEMVHVVADGYERVGALAEAQLWAERAVAMRRAAAPVDERDLARSVGLLGWIRHERSDYESAEADLRESLELWRTVGTDSVGLSRALNDLGAVLSTRGSLEESEAVLREALAIRRGTRTGSDRAIAITLNNLGSTLSLRGDTDEALALYEEAARRLEASLGPEHPRTLLARLNVAGTHGLLGNNDEWARIAAGVSEVFDRLGREDAQAGRAHESHGRALGFLGRFDESDVAVRRALTIFEREVGEHLLTGRAEYFMSTLRNAMGDRQGSLDYARRSVRTFRAVFEGDHAELATAIQQVGARTTDRVEQVAAYRDASEMFERLEGVEGPNTVRLTMSLARSLLSDGRYAAALELFEQLVTTVPAAYGEDHGYAPAPWLGMAEAHIALGDGAEARRDLESARSRMTGAGDIPPNRAWLERVEASLAEGGGG